MRRHPEIGARIVAEVDGLSHMAEVILADHERWDGKGYPQGLAGELIPIASRITFACDAYHAMVSDRPYRAAMSHAEAAAELRLHAGTQFDPRSSRRCSVCSTRPVAPTTTEGNAHESLNQAPLSEASGACALSAAAWRPEGPRTLSRETRAWTMTASRR
jgi:hypothetical protein